MPRLGKSDHVLWRRGLRLKLRKYGTSVGGISALALGFGLKGCSHEIRVNTSPPEAIVSQLDQKGNVESVRGETPLSFSPTPEIGFTRLEIKKAGYITETLVVPYTSNTNLEFEIDLREQRLSAVSESDRDLILNEFLPVILQLQNAIVKQNDDLVSELTKKHMDSLGGVSFFHSLLGNYYYIKQDLKKARVHYRKARNLSKKNREADRMLKLIESNDGNEARGSEKSTGDSE